MASLRPLDATLLGTTRAGRPGEDLGRKLHRTVVGQDRTKRSTISFVPTNGGQPLLNLTASGQVHSRNGIAGDLTQEVV
jgi:hypothetical protein